MVMVVAKENESVSKKSEEIKINNIKSKENGIKSELITSTEAETRDENEASSPEGEDDKSPVIEQAICPSEKREPKEAFTVASDAIAINLKFWQDAILQIIHSRLSRIASCSTPSENNIDEKELLAMFSNYDGEGEEIDEEGYRGQIKVFANYVATNAVIPKPDDYFNDDIDPEERKLEYTVRREIASAVIGEKMLHGYSQQNIPCLKCGMPLMKFHGVIDCVVCPVLVKEIDNALKIRRQKFLNQKVEGAQNAVIEAEAKKMANEEALQNLKIKEIAMRTDSTLFSAAAEVASELVVSASSKNYDVRKELEEAKQVSTEAWDLVNKRTEELKVEIEKSKASIVEAVATIEKGAAERHRINAEMSSKVQTAENTKSEAECDLLTANEEEHAASLSAAAAAEAVRLALQAQGVADKKYKEAQEFVKALSLVVEEKTSILTDTISIAEKNNKEANDEVQKAVQESSRIEKDTTAKVEKSHLEKCKTEEIAKKLDEEKMHKEARALVSERLAQLAIESREKAIMDTKEMKSKIEQSGENIKQVQEKIVNDRTQLETRKKIALERLHAVTNLRRELQMSENIAVENSGGNVLDSSDIETRDVCVD